METLKRLLEEEEITQWGVCRLADTLPLIDETVPLPLHAQSVIVCLFPYDTGDLPDRNLSRYATVAPYPQLLKKILERVCEKLRAQFSEYSFAAFAGNSPIREVRAAQQAGVGVIGKNGLLINEEYGSFVFIGEIVTDREYPYAVPKGGCSGCGQCEAACPGKALHDGRVDVTHCLSYLTQKPEPLTEEEEALVKKSGIVWGCDVCSEVCPMNQNRKRSRMKAFCERVIARAEEPQNDEELRDRAFGWRGAEVLRRNLKLVEGDKND